MTAPLRRQAGVTLIELMVGMVIGLLVTLVITQVSTVFEGRKRTTNAGSDAQLNGALALQALQRDILSAGYGFTSGGVAGCTQIRGRSGGVTYTWTMAPVLITQGTSGAPDTLRVLMSSNGQFAVPMRLGENQRKDGSAFVLDDRTNVGNSLNDLLLVVPSATAATQASPSPSKQVTPNWCTLAQITTDPSTTGNNLNHGTTGAWNMDATAVDLPGSLNSDIAYAAGSYLVNLGTMTDRLYRIPVSSDSDYATYPANSLLQRSFRTSAPTAPTTVPLFSQIVTLQAVYGLDTDANSAVDSWTTTTPTTTAGWQQVVAIRVAIVARSNQYEKDTVTTTQPSWLWNGVDSETLTVAGQVPCDTGDTTCWQHYRYRVFEAVIPLRNMLWQS